MRDLEHLKQLVSQFHPLPEEDWQALSAVWTPVDFGRKEIITPMGAREKYLYFVLEGVQRVYYYDEQGHEATILFTYAPSFGGVLDSFLSQKPSKYYFETLTPSRFLRAGFPELEKLMLSRHPIETMIRKGLSGTLGGLLERLVEIQCFSSEDKFRSLLQRSPHILQLVPHKYLASYLGIDATNFSKLMNKIKI